MSTSVRQRDYSIIGEAHKRAVEKGLVHADWYKSPIPRQKMKQLMQRKDGPAIRDTIIWFLSLLFFGSIAYASWGTWWAIPAFSVYGVFYYTPAQSRWHECAHGTAFKTTWMNEALYQVASFMSLMPATPWRWSHNRHHSDTIIVGSDPEIAQPRPPVWRLLIMEIFHLVGGPKIFMHMVRRAFGKLSEEEKSYTPETEYSRVFLESRIYLLIYVAVAIWCFSTNSILPAMFIGLPIIYGSFFIMFIAISQHLGLHEDVLDHRLNTRTYYTNPIIRFLYWNMNYHMEHHMFPMVPYHALPALHEEMKEDCPAPSPSAWAAFKETVHALWRQRKDPEYTVPRLLPKQQDLTE